jgi:hypothetical protein
MLQAVINGKAGRPASVADGATWRQVFRTSEDLLTATVFERLSYLDGPLLWEVLRNTFRPALLPPRKLVELLDVEFWPMWQDIDGGIGQDVEPDVVLTFSVGDPARTIVLIVECKLGGLQYPRQWARESAAFAARRAADPPDDVWLLALGGLPDSALRTVTRFTGEIRATYGTDVQALAADWSDLARVLDELDAGDPIAGRIIGDVKAALALNGYRNIRPMAELASLADVYRVSPDSAARLRMSTPNTMAPVMGATLQPKSGDEMINLGALAGQYGMSGASAARLRRFA